jgi:hypothetical protein
MSGYNDDIGGRIDLDKALEQLRPVNAWQDQVEQDDLGMVCLEDLKADLWVSGSEYLELLAIQKGSNQIDIPWVVIDY